VPFWVAAGISAVNFAFGWFVLPETLPLAKRRKFTLAGSNPFGTFKVFRKLPGVMPLVGVMAVFFFASSVYPAIWPFWGTAAFDWSTRTIGLTLAAFGLIAAVVQGGLSGPLVKAFGEHRVALAGLISAVVAAIGYGLAPSLGVVLVMLLIHAPEGLVHPMLSALMSRATPEDQQGQLQGGLSSVTNVAMLLGTLFFAQTFGFFMRPGGLIVSPSVSFFVAAVFLAVALSMFVVLLRRRGADVAGPVLVAPD
jgi:DHA1 family tetracycline resistance protein-like MFS transporter